MIRSLNITYLDSTHGADIIIQVEATERSLIVQAYRTPEARFALVEVRASISPGMGFRVEAAAMSCSRISASEAMLQPGPGPPT
jgi:hypothetical protein